MKTAVSNLPLVPIAYLLGVIGLVLIAWLIWLNLPKPDTTTEILEEPTKEIADADLETPEATQEIMETAESASSTDAVEWAGPTELLEIDHFQGEIPLGEAVTGTFQGSDSDTWLFITEKSVTVDVLLEGSAVESGFMRFFAESDSISTPTKEGQAREVGETTHLTAIPLDPGQYMIAVQDALGNGRYTLTVQESEAETAVSTLQPETTPVVVETEEKVDRHNLIGYCQENPDHCLATGNAEAAITVVEVTDYRCSFCRDFNQETALLLKAEYVASGRVYWLILPTAILDPDGDLFSNAAAVAALCLSDEFPDYASAIHIDLLNWQALEDGDNEELFPLVKAMDIDPDETFASCFENEHYWQLIQDNNGAVTEQGVESVPFFAINNLTLVGDASLETFRNQINRAIIDTINR